MEPRAPCPVRFEFSPSRVRFVGVAAQMHLSSLKFKNQIPKALSGGKEVSETATERETEAKARLGGPTKWTGSWQLRAPFTWIIFSVQFGD